MGSPVRHASCSHATPCPATPHLEVMRIARCGWPPCLHPARQSIIAADEVFGVEFSLGWWMVGRFFPMIYKGLYVAPSQLVGPLGFFFGFFWGLSGGTPYIITESYMRKNPKNPRLKH